ncbi:hydrolase/acyltransferase [Paenibacillus oenotherae]|uniref:Hydrolase/acyltransferase n=1 Tax=Paenibacillus oenotherae TaxID=1435645 RepID=A0ABS7DBA9_9BACL|nr:hydrolase/acyltransferase [Paenibacillus oenotherae]MBW7476787.1 hydrolase/acyltransferase [Paenibacillus oenotherae]
MALMRYIVMKDEQGLSFVEMPESHAYQLSALNLRLHKEIDKLTASNVPSLPYAVAECADLELHDKALPIQSGLDYMNELEKQFSSIQEKAYPLISLLTEIRALQAQLEQWYEEEMDA